MLTFGLDKHYATPLSPPEIDAWLTALAQRESGFWILKTPVYDISRSGSAFSIRKRGSGRNGPRYPLIKGRLKAGTPTGVALTISPNYLALAFSALFIFVFIPAIWLSDDMTINGERRAPELGEQLFFSLFAVFGAGFIAYFSALKPVRDAEQWLVNKLRLVELPAARP